MHHENVLGKGKYLENQRYVSYPHSICKWQHRHAMMQQSISTGRIYCTRACKAMPAWVGKSTLSQWSNIPSVRTCAGWHFAGVSLLVFHRLDRVHFCNSQVKYVPAQMVQQVVERASDLVALIKWEMHSQQCSSDMVSKNRLLDTGQQWWWGSSITSFSWYSFCCHLHIPTSTKEVQRWSGSSCTASSNLVCRCFGAQAKVSTRMVSSISLC